MPSDATLLTADRDGCFPTGFYSTTHLETEVLIDERWVRVDRPEMDCGVVVEEGHARTIAMTDVRRGMSIVASGEGVRIVPPDIAAAERQAFEFMSSEISTEKPKGLLVDRVAAEIVRVRAEGQRILWVAGPALIHTGAGPAFCELIRAGYVDALFGGNGLAAHDIESHLFGTSLGVELASGAATIGGHDHHIRAINEVRRHGSFKAAIDAGLFGDGIVFHLVDQSCEYLFGGSVRDDGPLPEVVTDMIEVQRRLRSMIWGDGGRPPVGLCIVIGTMLHGIAAGNCLPASVPLVCVDINPSTVTKLMDRGSLHSMAVVTDVGLFVESLARRLMPGEPD